MGWPLTCFQTYAAILLRLDHINYASWGTVYLTEMPVFQPEILLEYQKDNFVMKWNTHTLQGTKAQSG